MKAETLLPIALFLFACGGGGASSPPAETPPAPTQAAATDMPPPTPAAAPAPTAPPNAPVNDPPAAAAPPKVEFPPHATVDQAIKAVPQGAARMNMSNDVLQKPLLELSRYDKCKVPRSTKVSMTVARGMTWDKVPSLNQVTVNF
jgi:hypothetical protein